MNFFVRHFLQRFKYVAAGMFFLLLIISADAYAWPCPHGTTNKASGLQKADPRARMFFIGVIDSNDDSIGVRCRKDLEQMTIEFGDIADWIDVEMAEPKIIEGDEYSKAAVNDAIDNWLKNQQPSEDDIVVFYYSGHGFRYPTDASNYPRMWLKTGNDKNVEKNNLRIEEDVYNRIKKMGAGVTIVLSDCCNNTVAADNANFDNVMVPTRKRQTHKREHARDENANDNDDEEDYGDKLFIPDEPLSILITAAGKGELAGGNPNVGGFFTNYFLEALDACIYDNSIQPSWQNIFSYANDKAGYWARSGVCPLAKHNENGRCIQTAAIKIDGAK